MTDDALWRTFSENDALKLPEKSDWECVMFGAQITVRPDKGKEPNWFHRWMHRIAFGFVWRKVSK